MASSRMFASKIITTDRFQSMSRDSQFLYIHFGMSADDDGFLSSPKLLCRMIGCSEKHIRELTENGYLIGFRSGVYVITHWKINNYIKKDRYTETIYKEEKAHLSVAENGAYVYVENIENIENTEKNETLKEESQEKEEKKAYGRRKNVYLTSKEYEHFQKKYPDTCDEEIENLSEKLHRHHYTYPDHYLTLLKWAKEDSSRASPPEKAETARYDFDEIERKAFLNVHKAV